MSKLTESPGFRYMAGMLDHHGLRLAGAERVKVAGRPGGQWHGMADGVHVRHHTPGEPVLDDPGTQGCLLALAAELYGGTPLDGAALAISVAAWHVPRPKPPAWALDVIDRGDRWAAWLEARAAGATVRGPRVNNPSVAEMRKARKAIAECGQ